MNPLCDNPLPIPARYEPFARSEFSGRRQAVEMFLAWSLVSFGHELEPEEVTSDVAGQFVRWCLTDGPPDTRYERLRYRASIWCPVWRAAVDLTQELGRPPTMRDVFVALPRSYRQQVAKTGPTSAHAGRRHMRYFVQRNQAWVAQEPRGRDTFDEFVRSRRLGLPPPQVIPWDRIRIIIKPRTAYSLKNVRSIATQLAVVWRELSVSDGAPWSNIARELRNQSLRAVNRQTSTATANAIQAMLELPDHRTLTGSRDLAVACALVFWGLRATEVVRLKRSDIGLWGEDGKMRVRVESSTGGRERYLIVTTRMQRVLERVVVLLQQQQADGNKASSAYAAKLLEPDAPVFPATERWRSYRHVPPKMPMRPADVYRIVWQSRTRGPNPTQLRRYLDQTLSDLRVPRHVRDYVLRGRCKQLDAQLQAEADAAVVMLEAWLSEVAKIVW